MDEGADDEIKRLTVESLVAKLSSVSAQKLTEALCSLRLISKTDPASRGFIAAAGAVPYLADLAISSIPIQQENACATLLNLSISARAALVSSPAPVLESLSHALSHPSSPAAFQSSAAAIFSLLSVPDDHRSVIGSNREIVYSLVNAIRDRSTPPRSVKDALKALFAISLDPSNRNSIIDLGAVPALFSIVMKDGRVGIVEDATAVIAQIAGTETSLEAFGKVSGIRVLADVLDSATGSSVRTKENAVSALLNLVQFGGEDGVEEVKYAMGLGVLDGIEEVVERGSEKGKVKAAALLKAIDHHHSHNDREENEQSIMVAR